MTGDPRLAPVLDRIDQALAVPDDRRRELYLWLRYQLGWVDAAGHPAEARSAKGVRPLMCLVASEAVGGTRAAAVPAAAAIELTHEFSLVHDDIEDDDRTRRGRPALWTITGLAQGINAGDALYGIARAQLADSPVAAQTVVSMQRRYDRACVLLAEGQYLDLSFESATEVTVDDYLLMVERKTAALLAAATSLGALAGGAPEQTADAFARYGRALGIAFQIQDDVLGLWGDPARTGKPVAADLRRRKKSLPVLRAWDEPDVGPALRDLYGRAEVTEAEALSMSSRIEDAGLREACRQEARAHAAQALAALEDVPLASGPRDELAALVTNVVERDH